MCTYNIYLYGLSICMDMAMGADLVTVRMSPVELVAAR